MKTVKHSRSELSKYYPNHAIVDLSGEVLQAEVRILRNGVWYDILVKQRLDPKNLPDSFVKFAKEVYTQCHVFDRHDVQTPSRVQIPEELRLIVLRKGNETLKPSEDGEFTFQIDDGCYDCGSNNLKPTEYKCLGCGHNGFFD